MILKNKIIKSNILFFSLCFWSCSSSKLFNSKRWKKSFQQSKPKSSNSLPLEIATDLRERHWYEREKEKETKIETCIWRWVNDDLDFVSCALKGFEKEKIEGLIGYGFQKEKRKRNKEKRNNKECFFFLCFFFILQRKMKHKKCFFFLCFFFFFSFWTITYQTSQFFLFQIPSTQKTQNPYHHWLIFKYKSLSLFLFLFLSHISVSLLDQWWSLVEDSNGGLWFLLI